MAEIASEYSVSKVLIYQMKGLIKAIPPTAISVLEQEITVTESKIAELEKTLTQIEALKQEVKVKKGVLESLKSLPPYADEGKKR